MCCEHVTGVTTVTQQSSICKYKCHHYIFISRLWGPSNHCYTRAREVSACILPVCEYRVTKNNWKLFEAICPYTVCHRVLYCEAL